VFFVSVAAKGLSHSVIFCLQPLAGRCISVAAKDLRKRGVGERVTDWMEDPGGVRRPLGGGPGTETGMQRRTLFAGHGRIVPN